MIHSISAWLGLSVDCTVCSARHFSDSHPFFPVSYYYPGRSADLTRWIATDDDQNEQQQPQLAGEIVLYSLSTVVIQVDHQEQQQQQTWEKMVLQINVIPRGTTGHRFLRGLLYPGEPEVSLRVGQLSVTPSPKPTAHFLPHDEAMSSGWTPDRGSLIVGRPVTKC